MASVHTLAFAPAPDQGARVHYSLLELPAEILSSLETADLTIKGQPDDEAVLCTANQTYAIRASVNSNSLLLCRARDADADDAAAQGATLDIMTTLRQTLEVLPTRPRTERIEDLLRDSIWESEEADAAERPSKRRRRYTTDDLHDLVQASDGQIDDALTTSHVLTLGPDGHRRPVAPKVLPKLLTAMLESLSVNDLDPKLLNLADLIAAMPQEHDMSTEVAENVVNWFASGPPGAATLDIAAVVAELGRSLLVNWRPAAGTARSKAKEIPHEAFMEQWRAAVGEGNVGLCDLKLLAVRLVSTHRADRTGRPPVRRSAHAAPHLGAVTISAPRASRSLRRALRAATQVDVCRDPTGPRSYCLSTLIDAVFASDRRQRQGARALAAQVRTQDQDRRDDLVRLADLCACNVAMPREQCIHDAMWTD